MPWGFRGLAGEFGALEPAVWAPNASSHHGRKRVFTGLGLVNGSQETIEEVLAKAEEAGHRGDPGEITDPVGLKVKVSGVLRATIAMRSLPHLRNAG